MKIVLGALLWWRAPRRIQETRLTERLTSALKTGLRYARYNRDIDATLMRAVAFFLFASAYWALLPLIAKRAARQRPGDLRRPARHDRRGLDRWFSPARLAQRAARAGLAGGAGDAR